MDTTSNLGPVGTCRMARRAVIAAGLGAAGAAVLPALTAASTPIQHRDPTPAPPRYGGFLAGTTRSTPARPSACLLRCPLRDVVPLYPGDPPFTWHIDTDTRVSQHDEGGHLLEQITSLGTHTASHISAPVTSSSAASGSTSSARTSASCRWP